jgi:hypothetical protein
MQNRKLLVFQERTTKKALELFCVDNYMTTNELTADQPPQR